MRAGNHVFFEGQGAKRCEPQAQGFVLVEVIERLSGLLWISILAMNHFVFNLNISAQVYLQYYRGTVNKVVATCSDGKTVQFPAGLLTPFVTSGGVRGSFVLTSGDDGKGAALKRR